LKDDAMEKKTRVLFLMAVLTLACPLTGRSSQATSGSQTPTFQERYPRYRLRAGDVLDLNFTFTPEFNQSVRVQPDGYVNLKGVGDIRVQDRTTPEVLDAVRAAYSSILRDPTVTVELKEFEKPYFIVDGQVAKPGRFDLTGDTTVSQAVAIAGGFNDRAKNSEILVFRRVSDQWVEVQKVNLKQMVSRGDLSEDLHLHPGDMILVPRTTMSKLSRFIPVPTLGAYINPRY
jgi:polysaccharide biosynthesis/export protein